MGPSSLASWTLLIARALRRQGLDADAVFRTAHVAPSQLRAPASRYPLAAVRRLWAVASQASRDPCFGLEVGRAWHVTSFHALGYAALASATLREALGRVAHYCHVVSTGVRIDLVERDRHVALELTSALPGDNAPESLAPAAQAALAALTTLCREARGAPVDPASVLLVQQDARGAARLEAFFRCPVRFGASSNALVFAETDVDALLDTSNPALARLNERALQRYLSVSDGLPTGHRARHQVLASLPGGDVSQASVARALHMSVRTMQRKLASEGLVFRDVVDSARRQLAREYAQDPSLTKSEVAWLLGFAETRSLSRAVARWQARPDALS